MSDHITHLTTQELTEGAAYAAVMGVTLAAAMDAASIDCGEGLAIAAIHNSWYIVDTDDEDHGYLPVVAFGYVDAGRLVAF